MIEMLSDEFAKLRFSVGTKTLAVDKSLVGIAAWPNEWDFSPGHNACPIHLIVGVA